MATEMDVDEDPGIKQIQSELNQIECDTVKQYALLVDLQQKRKNLEMEIEKKNVELQNVNQLSLDLEAEVQYNQMRVIEMEKRQESNDLKIQEVRAEIEHLRSQIHDERSKSDLALQLFEKRKSEIMTTLLNAPGLFDQQQMRKNVAILKQNKANILQEIDTIDCILQQFSQKFQLASVDLNNINNLGQVCGTMQQSNTFAEQENKILKQKVEDQMKILKKLKAAKN